MASALRCAAIVALAAVSASFAGQGLAAELVDHVDPLIGAVTYIKSGMRGMESLHGFGKTFPGAAKGDEAKWLQVVMRLPASTVASNDLCTANDFNLATGIGRSPTCWKLEYSTDGETWNPADTRSGIEPPNALMTWYKTVNDGNCYSLKNTTADEPMVKIGGKDVAFTPELAASVKSGTPLDFATALTVDNALHEISFGGVKATVAAWYDIGCSADGKTLALALASDGTRTGSLIRATESVPAFQVGDGCVEVSLPDMKEGLFYALDYSAAVDFAPCETTDWLSGASVARVLTAPCVGDWPFYRVRVTDRN